MQYLSMGGRLTLINSTLDSIPTYTMSLFPMPIKVPRQLDKIRRNFLWEGNSKEHKFHLVKWSKCTMPKIQGGLGMFYMAAHNKSFTNEVVIEILSGKPSTLERGSHS